MTVITPEKLNEHYKQHRRCVLECTLRNAAEEGLKEVSVSNYFVPEFLAEELKAEGFILEDVADDKVIIKWN